MMSKGFQEPYDVSRTSDVVKTLAYSETYKYNFLDSVETKLRNEKHTTIKSVVKRKLYSFNTEEEANKKKEQLNKKYSNHF